MVKRARGILIALLLAGCATDGTVTSADFYGGMYYYDDWWHGGGCCLNYPDDIGPPNPHPEHPIALPPGSTPHPEHPIAKPPNVPAAPSRPMPAPRPSAPMRGGGGRGR